MLPILNTFFKSLRDDDERPNILLPPELTTLIRLLKKWSGWRKVDFILTSNAIRYLNCITFDRIVRYWILFHITINTTTGITCAISCDSPAWKFCRCTKGCDGKGSCDMYPTWSFRCRKIETQVSVWKTREPWYDKIMAARLHLVYIRNVIWVIIF